MTTASPMARRRDCGLEDCTNPDRKHIHTGPLVVGERVVLVPRTVGAPAICWANTRAVITELRPLSLLVRLEGDDRIVEVNRADVSRARTWRPPTPRRSGRPMGGQRGDLIDAENVSLPLDF